MEWEKVGVSAGQWTEIFGFVPREVLDPQG